MLKFLWIMISAVILISCVSNKEQQDDFSLDTLQVYATDVFLNESFYDESLAVFEDIFKCKIVLTTFADAVQMLDELTQNDSIVADVIFGLDNTLLHIALQESLFAEYEPSNLRFIEKSFRIDKTNHFAPICYSPIAFIYNSYTVEKAPETFGEMQDGIFFRKIILPNPFTTSLGRAMLIWSVAAFGENGYGHFWRSIKPNVYTTYDDHEAGYRMFLAAQAPMIVSLSSISVHHCREDNSQKYKSSVPHEGHFKLILFAGIARHSENRKLSENFIEFLLSNDFQRLIPESMWMFPCSKNINLSNDYLMLPASDNDYTSQVTIKTIARRFPVWLQRWEAIMMN